jgi:hypothetical protein
MRPRKPSKRRRYVLEGEWSGYRAEQRKIVHRTITREPDRYRHLHWVEFTDGTELKLRLRPCEPREQVVVQDSYSSLINQAAALNKARVTVKELPMK